MSWLELYIAICFTIFATVTLVTGLGIRGWCTAHRRGMVPPFHSLIQLVAMTAQSRDSGQTTQLLQ